MPFTFTPPMLDPPMITAVGVASALGAFVGWLVTYLNRARKIRALANALALETEMNRQRHAALEKTFAALSAEALNRNNHTFIELAQQVLARFHTQARGDLDVKQQAISNLVAPIRDALNKAEHQLQQLERERRQSYGALSKHLETLIQTQQELKGETRNLVQALRRPEIRGQWGELTLRRLVELAGMVEHCDFVQQAGVDEGRLRPDMVVHMPGRRQVVVDVKTPLDAYLSAVEATDDATRQQLLGQHARHVRGRVRELAGKRYWQQFETAPEFVILFIPGDQFLAAALDADHSLLEDALAQRVVLATPTSLVALLRAIAYGWRQQALGENAEKIRDIGQALYQRIGMLAEHLAKLGKHMDASVTQFNRVVGSFESNVLPGARKFSELGVSDGEEVGQPSRVGTATRTPASFQQTDTDDPAR